MKGILTLVVCSLLKVSTSLGGQASDRMPRHNDDSFLKNTSYFSQFDSSSKNVTTPEADSEPSTYRNVWGLDILISDGGFGLGTFYRREFSEDIFGFASFSISESKDERDVEFFDPFTGTSFTPQKLNRFLVMPLMFGVQHRVFKDEIMDTFRPYVNAAVGPTLIFVTPNVEITRLSSGLLFKQVEFFESFGKGQAHYTVGSFIGFGANFGSNKSNILGVNFRYYFTYLFGDGLPSRFNDTNGEVAATKKSFGGFFITFNIGMGY